MTTLHVFSRKAEEQTVAEACGVGYSNAWSGRSMKGLPRSSTLPTRFCTCYTTAPLPTREETSEDRESKTRRGEQRAAREWKEMETLNGDRHRIIGTRLGLSVCAVLVQTMHAQHLEDLVSASNGGCMSDGPETKTARSKNRQDRRKPSRKPHNDEKDKKIATLRLGTARTEALLMT